MGSEGSRELQPVTNKAKIAADARISENFKGIPSFFKSTSSIYFYTININPIYQDQL